MTRETKIGLLVGLAFTILIGILLTEHLSSINEPQPAPFSGSGANVRDGVATPGTNDDGPPVSIAGGPVDAPRQTVPTNADLHPPVAYVAPRPNNASPRSQGNPASAAPFAAGLDPSGNAPNSGQADAAGSGSRSDASRGARELIHQHPGDLIPYDPNGAPPATLAPAARSGPATPAGSYTAVAGDSVSRIAARLMGGNTRANRELLIRANPSLQNNGNVVVIGRSYVIPGSASTVSHGPIADARVANPGAGPADPTPPVQHARSSDSDGRPEAVRWYTVKGDDNLWRIAESQLGSGTAWTQIRDMNKDVLKDGETVRPNMRLRLPAKTAVAGVN